MKLVLHEINFANVSCIKNQLLYIINRDWINQPPLNLFTGGLWFFWVIIYKNSVSSHLQILLYYLNGTLWLHEVCDTG